MKESLLEQAPGGRLDLEPSVRVRLGGGSPAPEELQLAFTDLGPELIDVTFVVVDLETTGGGPGLNSITEFGAVKVRGGEVIGEFATLVNPGVPIPPFITVLTGITTAMTVVAPKIGQVMPSFLEFLGSDPSTVLVAHNAGFDVGHLKAAAKGLDLPFPRVQVLDTVKLARRTFSRDEVPNYKLGTLARICNTSVEPSHRALDDARATVDVLHVMLGRLAGLGVTHMTDLVTAADPVPAHRRKKAVLAEGLPKGPGCYKFIGPGGEVMYVGTSRNVYSRVRTYFTAAEKRKRMAEMIDLAIRVDAESTATVLEANVLEMRLIDELDPPYNRRSRNSQARPWLTLTKEAHPRLTVARKIAVEDLDAALGPFSGVAAARRAQELLADVSGLRTCTQRLPLVADGRSACHLAEIGRCSAPCKSGEVQGSALSAIETALAGDLDAVVDVTLPRLGKLALDERFEQAATERDRLYTLVTGAKASASLRPLLTSKRLVAAAQEKYGWEIVVVDFGALRGTALARPGEDPRAVANLLTATLPQLDAPPFATGAAPIDEIKLVANWLWRSNVRFLDVDDPELLTVARNGAQHIKLPAIPSRNDLESF